jgi:hypothetical protein
VAGRRRVSPGPDIPLASTVGVAKSNVRHECTRRFLVFDCAGRCWSIWRLVRTLVFIASQDGVLGFACSTKELKKFAPQRGGLSLSRLLPVNVV